MGNGALQPSKRRDSADAMLNQMMPLYYQHNVILSPEDETRARTSWKRIIDNASESFVFYQEHGALSCDSCLSWFYCVFYERLFDILPDSKLHFADDIFYRGKFLIKLIATLLSTLNAEKFQKNLKEFQNMVSIKDMTLYEVSIIGEVIFYTLKYCLEEDFSIDIECSWKRLFSHLMQNLVPLHVQGSLHKTKSQRSCVSIKLELLA